MAFDTISWKITNFISQLISGTLSIGFSCRMIYLIFRDKLSENGWRTYDRLMLGIGVTDIIFSLSVASSTLPMPRDSGILFAIGNDLTCSIQGFLGQLGAGLHFYHASLCIHFLLILRYNMKETVVEQQEKWFHLVPVLFGVVSSILGAIYDAYNIGENRCQIVEYPTGCTKDETIPCESGENAILFRYIFALLPTASTVFIMTVSMVMIYRTVWKIENRMLKYDFGYQRTQRVSEASSNNLNVNCIIQEGPTTTFCAWFFSNIFCVCTKRCRVRNISSTNSRIEDRIYKKTRRVAKHALLYCGSFGFTYIWSFIYRHVGGPAGIQEKLPLVLIISNFTIGFQGVLTYFIFVYRRNKNSRRKKKSVVLRRSREENNDDRNIVEAAEAVEDPTSFSSRQIQIELSKLEAMRH